MNYLVLGIPAGVWFLGGFVLMALLDWRTGWPTKLYEWLFER